MKAAIVAGCVVLSVSLGASGAHAQEDEIEVMKRAWAQCKQGDQKACQLVRSIGGTEGQWVTYKDVILIGKKGSHVWGCFAAGPVTAKTRKQADWKCAQAQEKLRAKEAQEKLKQ
jgi:hypothetical protein